MIKFALSGSAQDPEKYAEDMLHILDGRADLQMPDATKSAAWQGWAQPGSIGANIADAWRGSDKGQLARGAVTGGVSGLADAAKSGLSSVGKSIGGAFNGFGQGAADAWTGMGASLQRPGSGAIPAGGATGGAPQAAPKAAPKAAPAYPSNVPKGQYETIGQGQTLSGIAKQRGMSMQDLLAANPQIANPNKIQAGAKINMNTQGLTGGQKTLAGSQIAKHPFKAPAPAMAAKPQQPVPNPTAPAPAASPVSTPAFKMPSAPQMSPPVQQVANQSRFQFNPGAPKTAAEKAAMSLLELFNTAKKDPSKIPVPKHLSPMQAAAYSRHYVELANKDPETRSYAMRGMRNILGAAKKIKAGPSMPKAAADPSWVDNARLGTARNDPAKPSDSGSLLGAALTGSEKATKDPFNAKKYYSGYPKIDPNNPTQDTSKPNANVRPVKPNANVRPVAAAAPMPKAAAASIAIVSATPEGRERLKTAYLEGAERAKKEASLAGGRSGGFRIPQSGFERGMFGRQKGPGELIGERVGKAFGVKKKKDDDDTEKEAGYAGHDKGDGKNFGNALRKMILAKTAYSGFDDDDHDSQMAHELAEQNSLIRERNALERAQHRKSNLGRMAPDILKREEEEDAAREYPEHLHAYKSRFKKQPEPYPKSILARHGLVGAGIGAGIGAVGGAGISALHRGQRGRNELIGGGVGAGLGGLVGLLSGHSKGMGIEKQKYVKALTGRDAAAFARLSPKKRQQILRRAEAR